MRLFIIGMASLIAFACSGSETKAVEEQTAAVVTSASGDIWVVDYPASKVGFMASQQGSEFKGQFNSFEATIILDPDNLDNASISATIDMKSADAGDSERNGSLPTSDWFNVKKYPMATFQSSEISKVADNAYEATGTLTIRDVTKDVALPFTLNIADGVGTAIGELTMVRTDYGVGQGAFSSGQWIDLTVLVTVNITAKKP